MTTTSQIIDYNPPQDHLKDRIILVSGAGDGIGREVALACAKHGATVLLTGRTITKLEQTYDAISEQNGSTAVICPFDLEQANSEDYWKLNADIETQFGRLDGLVNNAAILGQRTPMNHYKLEIWNRVMKINVTAQYQLTQGLMPTLEASHFGASIVFTSSSLTNKCHAFWGAYAVSKFAIEGLAQTWAEENNSLSPLRINIINPGAAKTRLRAEAFPAENQKSLRKPSLLVPAYLYLLGDHSLGINGQTINA